MTLQPPEQVTGLGRFLPGLTSIAHGARHTALADSRAALTVCVVVPHLFVRDVTERLVASDPPATALVLDLEGVSDIDTTAVQQLDELDEADVSVSLARVRTQVLDMLERAKIIDRLGGEAVHLEVDDAVDAYRGTAH